MKKFYIIFVALFVVNAATGQGQMHGTSKDASAQNKHSQFTLHKPKPTDQGSFIRINDNINHWGWNIPSNEWIINYKIVNRVYNADSLLTSEIYQAWNGTTWENTQKYSCTFDTISNLTTEFGQTWNNSAWVNSYHYTYTYDANNNRISELDQTWNAGTWVNSYRSTYSYDAHNNLASELYQDWNGSAWINSLKITYTYDANNNRSGVKEVH